MYKNFKNSHRSNKVSTSAKTATWLNQSMAVFAYMSLCVYESSFFVILRFKTSELCTKNAIWTKITLSTYANLGCGGRIVWFDVINLFVSCVSLVYLRYISGISWYPLIRLKMFFLQAIKLHCSQKYKELKCKTLGPISLIC